jgi:hypothetical protein
MKHLQGEATMARLLLDERVGNVETRQSRHRRYIDENEKGIQENSQLIAELVEKNRILEEQLDFMSEHLCKCQGPM